jgi:hypothetical protein
MSGGKGGSQTTQIEIPDYLEGPIRQNIAQAQDIAKIGYVPQYGPDVAGFSPMQQAAFSNTNQAAGAFGMQGVNTAPQYAPMQAQPAQPAQGGGKGGAEPAPQPMQQIDPYTGMPALQPGQMGYSSGDIFEQNLNELEQRRPAQKAALDAQFIDPYAEPSASGKGGGSSTPVSALGSVAAKNIYAPPTYDEGQKLSPVEVANRRAKASGLPTVSRSELQMGLTPELKAQGYNIGDFMGR